MSRVHPPMRLTRSTFLGVATSALLISGCWDEPTVTASSLPVESELTSSRGSTTGRTHVRVLNRFELELTASGTLRPGEPIEISVGARALLPTSSAELRIHVPEMELADLSGWGDAFRYDSSGPVPPVLSTVRSQLARDQRMADRTQVTPLVAGYYRVVATLTPTEPAARVFAGLNVQNQAVAEIWLLVTETGGKVTQDYDEAVFPSGVANQPGPFRRSRALDRRKPTSGEIDARVSHASSRQGASAMMGGDFITFHARYYNVDISAYDNAESVKFVVDGCTIPEQQFICESEDWEEVDSGYADGSGLFYFPCTGDEYEVYVSTYAGIAAYHVWGGTNSVWGEVEEDCGETVDIVVPSINARVYANLALTRSGASAFFGASRSFINVHVYSSFPDSTGYYRGDDRIVIGGTDQVWGDFGAWVTAHEYGHAYHNDALWGNETPGGCGLHFIDTESDLGCAYSEGFADYFGVVTRSDVDFYSTSMEENHFFPGCISRASTFPHGCSGQSLEGSVIEGAFAAVLFDLTDAGVEPHDSVAAPGSYVRDVIRTCEVKYASSNWRRANGTDEIVFCLENSIDPDGYLSVRGVTPEDYFESATESGGWTAARVRKIWKWNLYEKPVS